MTLKGLHLLLTYQCTLECEHCFVWSSPYSEGTMSLQQVRQILRQGQDLGTIEEIYFEGGEPFLCYPILVKAVQEAHAMGFRVGIVSNGFWANSYEDALEWLSPFRNMLSDFSLSNDLYHWSDAYEQRVKNAVAAAEFLGIPVGTISIAQPEATNAAEVVGQLPLGESKLMYRGRATEKLAPRATLQSVETFTSCPYENLSDPGRVHIDPLGYVHLCQGISLGNVFETPFKELWANYVPEIHPIAGVLLQGGPLALMQAYEIDGNGGYADACHLCYAARQQLRSLFPEILVPDQMYGEGS